MKMGRRCLPLALSLTLSAAAAAEPPAVSFVYALSDFSGPVHAGEARVVVDSAHREVYVAAGRDIHVFNAFGMEVYGFNTGLELGPILDLAVLDDGSLLVLAYDPAAPPDTPLPLLSHRDFRGRPLATHALSGPASQLEDFRPNRLFLQGDRLFLLSTNQLRAVAATLEGEVLETFDLAPIVGVADDERNDVQVSGAGMDSAGNLALSFAVLFRVFLVSRDGTLLATWGKAGSGAGGFGNVGGIDVDDAGRTYVVDRIRKSVMVFDADEKRTFLGEFGGDKRELGWLGMPSGIVLDGQGRAYVTQVGQAPVSVFQVR
jgi:DNA-binding beta-propeller fold protein YncE